MTSIGKNIKEKRKALNITQEELAEKLNVTRQAVSNWENGKTEPDIGTLTKMAQIFDISIDELVGGKRFGIFDRISKKRLYILISFIAFSIISLIAFEVISPIMKDYVYKYYDYRFYYPIVAIWKPIAIILGVFGIFDLFLKMIDWKIKNKIVRTTLLIFGTAFLIIVFASNIITCILIFYSHYKEVAINTYVMSPAFFMMKNQILYSVPAIMLSLGLSEKTK